MVAKKVKMALDQGLNIVLCIGEKLSEREAGKTLDVCLTQVDAVNSILINFINNREDKARRLEQDCDSL